LLPAQNSCRSVCEKYLARIQEIDKAGPALNSVIEINPDVLSIADALDRERKSNKIRGPLRGVPIVLKDNVDTGDGMNTMPGSLGLLGSRAPKDALVAVQLCKAGAVILARILVSGQHALASFHQRLEQTGWTYS
jgi:amidase